MMLAELGAAPILAQISRWERLGDGLRRSGSQRDLTDLWPLALMIILGSAIAYAAVVWRRRNDMARPCNDPEKLFRELCLTHNLEPENKRLLRQLAEACGFAQPALVFLRPDVFVSRSLPSNLAEQASRFDDLKRRLF